MEYIEYSSSSLPYPEVSVSAPNPRYARLMLDDLGGRVSEMSAIGLYFYDNLITEAEHPQIAKVFQRIMIVEMQHLQIFGQLALNLGADPRLWHNIQNQLAYWTPRYINYPREIKPLIQNALQSELEAIDKYAKQARQIADPQIVANIERIIKDEEIHVDIFRQILENL